MPLKVYFKTEMMQIVEVVCPVKHMRELIVVHRKPSLRIRVTIVTSEDFYIFFLVGRLMSKKAIFVVYKCLLRL